MKVLVLCLAVLLASSGVQSSFLDSFKDVVSNVGTSLKTTFDSLKQPLTQLTTNLLDQLKTTGTQLLAQGASTLLGNLQSIGQPATRDIAAVGQFLEQGRTLVHSLAEQAKSLFGGAVAKLTEVANEMSSLDFLSSGVHGLFAKIDSVTHLHDIMQDGLIKNLGERLMKVAGNTLGSLFAGHKRSASTYVDPLGKLLSNIFKPFTDMAKQHVATLGTNLKDLTTNLVTSLQGPVDKLKAKLSPQIAVLQNAGTQLGQLATNTLTAASQGLTKVLGETFNTLQPVGSNIKELIKNGTTVLANTLNGN